ncbi:hypothetical protein PR002_g10855 [Phytophthora rubi]|uniref:Cadmium resistance transporter n=2 Tax=Phytophthora rubi TaxID=129364 RepID=A0A6A3MEM4_9STRA|nr:hypothetical protein PR002_g10855 [Phytophthora rubi]
MKMGTWGVLSSAMMMFASTNLDDALVLIVYFADAAEGSGGLKAQDVWSGQLLGFSAIMTISLLGVGIGSYLQPRYSGLLGLVPLCMGLQRMREWWKADSDAVEGGGRKNHQSSVSALKTGEVSPQSPDKGSYKVVADDVKKPRSDQLQDSVTTTEITLCSRRRDPTGTCTPTEVCETEEELLSWTRIVLKSERLSSIFSTQSLMIAAVTLGNGGDNVAVYVPGLVTYKVGDIVLTVGVFYALVVTWIFIAGRFVSFGIVAKFIDNYGDYIIPITLVLLGVYILSSTDAIGMVGLSW